MTPATAAARRSWRRPGPQAKRHLVTVARAPAATVMMLLLVTSSRHGFHGDELYFRALPMAWWYDDQPPLTVWLARASAYVSDAVWVQRLPAVAAAGAGAVVAAGFPRVLGYGPRVQRVAAWSHAFTVYPLLMGHVFLTASLDLFAWQLVALCVVMALMGHRHAMAWAGLVAGVACWNKLLVLIFVAALGVALCVGARSVLRQRSAVIGGLILAAIGGFPVGSQLVHGLPMSTVSRDLVAAHGTTNRWLVVPLLVAFLGPPLLPVWWRGLRWRGLTPSPLAAATPEDDGIDGLHRSDAAAKGPSRVHPLPVIGVAAGLVLVWSLAVPGQPYYPVAAFLPALALGWGQAAERGSGVWRRARTVIAANGAVAVVVCLPVVPASSPGFGIVAGLNPVMRDEVGWPNLVHQLARARGGGDAAVVVDAYALAGAAVRYGPDEGLPREAVASGHNALWSLGPPREGTEVVLTGRYVALRGLFTRCADARRLEATTSDPFALDGTRMLRCSGPRQSWARLWPKFKRLGG